MSDDYERVKTWCNDPRKMPCAPYNSICRVFEDYDRLRAELAEARRLIDEARKQVPVAWAYHFSLHAYHDDFFDNEAFSDVLLKRRRELSPDDAFGRRGIDFDEKALITEVPLYAAPVPAQPAVPDDVAKDAARYRWLRDRNNSLETRQYDKGIYNGQSCYHEVEGIRELKHGETLDAAIDAAILSTTEGRKDV